MSKFTALDAREIVAEESFSTPGYVKDQIKKAARNGQESVSITGLRLKASDEVEFKQNGFTIVGNNISWKETAADKKVRLAKEATEVK
jgi:hypothetical protein